MKAWIKRFFGFSVTVQWEDVIVVHYSMSVVDALDWMKQYPKEANVVVQDWVGCFVAAR